jgi:hypothetical protein
LSVPSRIVEGMSDWHCEAYGPPEAGVDPAVWPKCFAEAIGGRCASPAVCARVMAAERQRVFRCIQEGAAGGDETMVYLAGEFASPDQLLGGPPDAS